MGSSKSSFYFALLIPAFIATATYLITSFVILPLWARYKNRYTRYLPLDAVSAASTTVRDRIADFVTAYMLPARLRAEMQQDGDGHSDEELDEYAHISDTEATRRREALSLSLERNNQRRLSRDLEQGFASDSDSEQDGRNRRT